MDILSVIIGVFAGAIVGYLGSLFQHRFELERNKQNEIRKLKLHVYSDILKEVASFGFDFEKRILPPENNHWHNDYPAFYRNKFTRLFSPAILLASDELKNDLIELIDIQCDIIQFFVDNDKLIENKDPEAFENELINKAAGILEYRNKVVNKLRKEIKE